MDYVQVVFVVCEKPIAVFLRSQEMVGKFLCKMYLNGSIYVCWLTKEILLNLVLL